MRVRADQSPPDGVLERADLQNKHWSFHSKHSGQGSGRFLEDKELKKKSSKSQLWNRLVHQIGRSAQIRIEAGALAAAVNQTTANPVTLRNVSNRMSDFRSASCSRLQIKYAHFLFLRWSILLNKINTVFGEKASNNHYIIIQCKQQSLQGNDQLTAWDLSILRIKDVRVLHSLLVFGKVPGCAGGTAFLRSSTQSAGGLWSMWPDRSPRSSQTSEKKPPAKHCFKNAVVAARWGSSFTRDTAPGLPPSVQSDHPSTPASWGLGHP